MAVISSRMNFREQIVDAGFQIGIIKGFCRKDFKKSKAGLAFRRI